MGRVTSLGRRLFDLGYTESDANQTAIVTRTVMGLTASFGAASWVRATALAHSGAWRYPTTMALFLGTACVVLYVAVGRPAFARVSGRRSELLVRNAAVEVESERHRFLAELQDAFEMVDSEADACGLVTRALPLVHANPGEMLLADSSRAHLVRAAVSANGTPGCGVAEPSHCPAVRRGHSTHFPSSTALSSCPRLTERGPGVSALCVPITILGTPMGVLHVTDPEGTLHTLIERTRVESLAAQAGARIGAIRAAAASRLAATTDPLTGLLNRRSMADDLQQLSVDGRRYAVAFSDLDSFKRLNDTYGHAAGDHALRLFARTLTATIRTGDIAARYGGEQFVVLFPDADVTQAAPVVHRIREALAAATSGADSGTPAFTASFGLADSSYAVDPIDVIALADAAVLQAKREGRDRLLIGERPTEEQLASLQTDLGTRDLRDRIADLS